MPERTTLEITPNWKATLLAALLLPLLLSLGFWQLDRAEEKRVLKQLYSSRQMSPPVSLSSVLEAKLESPAEALAYLPVTLKGRYLNERQVMLDNRIYQQRFGYEIITPFELSTNGEVVMVNRGWLQGDLSRRSLPQIEAINGELDLLAEIYVPQGEMMQLAHIGSEGWPRVVQSIDIHALSEEFPAVVFPYTVRLQQGQPGAFTNNWMVVNIQPEKHVGYAVQWFAMSSMLLLIVLLANTNIWQWIKSRRT